MHGEKRGKSYYEVVTVELNNLKEYDEYHKKCPYCKKFLNKEDCCEDCHVSMEFIVKTNEIIL